MRSRKRAGFSLIELFVVLVVVAILATLALPRFRNFKRKYYITTLVSDLRNLATAQEAYWNVNKFYTGDTASIDVSHSPGVSLTLISASGTGWSATAAHDADPGAVCSIYYGDAEPVPPATTKNYVGCTE